MYIIQQAAVLSCSLPNKICVMLIPLYRCLVTFGVLWLFLTVLWITLPSVIAVLPDHTHLLSTYFLHTHPYFNQESAKEWDRGCPWGGGYSTIPRT